MASAQSGNIILSGSICNTHSGWLQSSLNIETQGQHFVTINATSGQNLSVSAINVGGLIGENRWRSEQAAFVAASNYSPNSETQVSLQWSNGIRGFVSTPQPDFHFTQESMPSLLWQVNLLKSNIVVDTAYLWFTTSGSFIAARHSGHPWSGAEEVYTLEGSSVLIDGLALYEVLNTLTVKLEVLDERSNGEVNYEIVINKKSVDSGPVFGGQTNAKNIEFETDERKQGGAVTDVDVILYIDGEEYARRHTPASFPENQYEIDFGLIHYPCFKCEPGKVQPGFSGIGSPSDESGSRRILEPLLGASPGCNQ
jgi:hypothetical protein